MSFKLIKKVSMKHNYIQYALLHNKITIGYCSGYSGYSGLKEEQWKALLEVCEKHNHITEETQRIKIYDLMVDPQAGLIISDITIKMVEEAGIKFYYHEYTSKKGKLVKFATFDKWSGTNPNGKTITCSEMVNLLKDYTPLKIEDFSI
jgi:hypothetical protein